MTTNSPESEKAISPRNGAGKNTGLMRWIRHPVVREYAEAIFYAFLIAMVVRTFVVQAFKIPTGSMEPTLHGATWGGDKILVNKFIYWLHPPERGDIVVFSTKGIEGLDSGKDYVKRLVGLPGDEIEIIDGHIYLNGKRLERPDIFNQPKYFNTDFEQGPYGRTGEKIKVPADHYYVLGDNSANSRDSRYWGFVPKKCLKGRAMVIYWPPSRVRILQ